MKKSSIYLLTLSLLLTATLATGCRKGLSKGENEASENGLVQISFQNGAASITTVGNSNGWESSAPHTKADPESGPEVTSPDRLPVGTTFRLVVYNAGDDPKTTEPVAQNTYKVADSEGKVLATLVDEFGTALDGSDTSAIILRRGDYDFYYFSPAIPIGKSTAATYSDLIQDVDYMALYQRQSVDPSKGRLHGVTGVNFYRMASYIDIKIAPKEGEIMGTLEVDPSYGLEVYGFTNSGYYEIGGYPYYMTTEGTGGMIAYSALDFAAVPNQTATISTEEAGGGHIVLPGVATDFRISGVVLSDGATKRVSTSLGTQIFEPGYRYLIELGISRVAEDPTINITVLPWNEVDWNDTEIGGKYPPVDASVSPEPSSIIPTKGGSAFTVTLTSPVMWTTPLQVRLVNNDNPNIALASGTITYSSTLNGGSVIISVPENSAETMRNMHFQYQWAEQWYDIQQLVQQQGTMIDIGTGFLLMAVDPHLALPWTDAINYCKSQGTGWRLPTHNEMMLLNCLTPTLSDDQEFNPVSSDYPYYWTCTEYAPQATTEAWYGDPIGGNILYASINESNAKFVKSYSLNVRCVKSKSSDANQILYPKIDLTNAVITLRDAEGGFPTSMLFSQRLDKTAIAVVYNGLDHENHRMSRKFRIQKSVGKHFSQATTHNLTEAAAYCDALTEDGFSDWRVPSLRELMLIWILGANDATAQGDIDNSTANATSHPVMSNSTKLTSATNFQSFESAGYVPAAWDATTVHNCWTVSFVEGLTGLVGAEYVRCVRDEEW